MCHHAGMTTHASQGSARDAFEVEAGTTYLDAATYGLPPRDTVAAIERALAAWAHGSADWIEDWDRPAEDARSAFASLTGVPEASVALLPAVSVGTGLVAAALQPGDEVLMPDDEFTSVTFPFEVAAERGVVVRRAAIGSLADEVTPRTTLVATSLVQMQTGMRADLPAIREATDRVGARLLLDATQAIPFVRADEDLATVDYVLSHGYKHLLCPRGAAFMAIRADHVAALPPLNANWRAAELPYADYFAERLPLPATARRFDVSLAWHAWVGARVSLRQLLAWREAGAFEAVWALAELLSTEAGLGPAASTLVCVPVASPDDAAAALRAAGIRASVRGSSVRLSVHLWNDASDVHRALDVLAPYMP